MFEVEFHFTEKKLIKLVQGVDTASAKTLFLRQLSNWQQVTEIHLKLF